MLSLLRDTSGRLGKEIEWVFTQDDAVLLLE
jgi:hypothetical protein